MTAKSNKSHWSDAKFVKPSLVTDKILGMSGRMLYRSKSLKQPTTIFNANIFNARAEKIWVGDIEIERDKEALCRLSKRIGTALYTLGDGWEIFKIHSIYRLCKKHGRRNN